MCTLVLEAIGEDSSPRHHISRTHAEARVVTKFTDNTTSHFRAPAPGVSSAPDSLSQRCLLRLIDMTPRPSDYILYTCSFWALVGLDACDILSKTSMNATDEFQRLFLNQTWLNILNPL